MHQQEITRDQVPGIQVSQCVSHRSGGGFHYLEGVEGRRVGVRRVPFRGLDVAFYFCGMGAAVDVNVRNSGHGEEFKRVFNKRRVC